MLAHATIEGIFDFNRTPLAPTGIKVLVHKKTQQCKTWGTHGVHVWYTRPAMEHYMYYTKYIPNTMGEIHADVLELLTQHLIMPGLSTT